MRDLMLVAASNGSFAGVRNIFINSQGYTLDAEPVADFGLRAARGHAFRVSSPGDLDFALSVGNFANPFAQECAAGDIDNSSVQINAVLEVQFPGPTSLSLLQFTEGTPSLLG